MLSTKDQLAIHEVIALHGHLIDDGRLDELHLAFADNAVFDLNSFGLGVQQGLAKIRKIALELGDNNPIGHHVTNIVITKVEAEDVVHTRSKGIGVNLDGTTSSAVYTDILKKQDNGWRIVSRKIVARHKPLTRE